MKKKIISYLLLIIVFVGCLFLMDGDLDVALTSTSSLDDEISIGMVILCEAFVSIHMSVFVLFPLASIINKNKVMKWFVTLFCIRLVILIIGDIMFPSVMMIVDFMAVFIGAFILVPVLGVTKRVVYKGKMAYHEYEDMDDYELSGLGFSNRDLLKKVLIEQYIDIKQAFSDFDYKRLVELCSKNKYMLYKNELKLLEQVGEKKMFKDFRVIDSKIYDGYKSNDGIRFMMILKLEYYEYTVDNYNKVTHGSDVNKKEIMMRLSFFKSLSSKEIDECPNCGSPVTVDSMEYCSYCGTELNFRLGEFVLDTEDVENYR